MRFSLLAGGALATAALQHPQPQPQRVSDLADAQQQPGGG